GTDIETEPETEADRSHTKTRAKEIPSSSVSHTRSNMHTKNFSQSISYCDNNNDMNGNNDNDGGNENKNNETEQSNSIDHLQTDDTCEDDTTVVFKEGTTDVVGKTFRLTRSLQTNPSASSGFINTLEVVDEENDITIIELSDSNKP
ncbi:histone deacetylase, partial [Reticulomyxa filosa]